MAENRRVAHLRARGQAFEDAWAGKQVSLRGAVVRDGDAAVLVPEDSAAGGGREVVGRCADGVFFPTYRTRGAL